MAKCRLCPQFCDLKVGELGACKVRAGTPEGSKLVTYGHIASAAFGPIEQKPIYHFRPGLRILSLGSNGCNMTCKYCQNFEISQVGKRDGAVMMPDEAVALAESKGAKGIAFTYSEPLIWYEYVVDVAKAARKRGLATILKTNAYCDANKFAEMALLMDAINIDVKGGPRLYREVCGVEFNTPASNGPRLYSSLVLHNLAKACEVSHVEVSVILIPGYEDELPLVFSQIQTAGHKGIPVHLLRFVPDFKMRDVPPTSMEAMFDAQKMAKQLLSNVYLGYSGAKNITRCSKCQQPLVSRLGIAVEELSINGGSCGKCGAKHDIIVPCDTTSAVPSAT